jgi:hypothetical protein
MKNDPATMIGTVPLKNIREVRVRTERDIFLQGTYFPFEVYSYDDDVQEFYAS